MPKVISFCDNEITEDFFLEVHDFLEGYSLSARSALVLFEVANSLTSKRRYIGADLISRKLRAYNFSEVEVEEIFKNLMHPTKELLRIYPSKKEVLCCKLSGYGADVVALMKENCYSTLLTKYDEIHNEFSKSKKRKYANPDGWKPMMKKKAWNENGESMNITILDLKASNNVSHESLGIITYGTIASLELECIECRHKNVVEINFDFSNFWNFPFVTKCMGCGQIFQITKDTRIFKFLLAS
jgi:hypothetical protein